MKLYTFKEVAELLKVHEGTVAGWAGSGEIASINVSQSRTSRKQTRRISEEALGAFLRSRETAARIPTHSGRRKLQVVERFIK